MKDLTGKRFGKLIVTGYAFCDSYSGDKIHYWHCRCDCGNEVDVRGESLKYGFTKSCGCLRKQLSAERSKQRAKRIELNGESHTVKEWSKILGIGEQKIYRRILKGHSPEEVLSVKNLKSGGKRTYPREKLKKFEFNGETLSIKEWSERTGLSYQSIYSRIVRGVPEEKVLDRNRLN